MIGGDNESSILDKHHGLGTWYLKAPATTHIFTSQHVVDPNHVVSRLLIPHPILFVRTARRRLLLCPLQPTNFVFHAFTAMRAAIGRLLEFLLLVEKILFVHFKLRLFD